MPGNEVGNELRDLFELESFFQGQNHFRVVDGGSALNWSQFTGKPVENGVPLNFNLKNCDLPELDCLSGLGAESECSRSLNLNHQISRNAFANSNQCFQAMQNQLGLFYESGSYNQSNLVLGGSSSVKFQLENDSVGSPTLTNSERSEITEASTDFYFPERQQGSFSVQQQDFPQRSPMQQSGYDEMQLLQQQLMLKQLQDLQRQQQLQQHNHLTPFSTIHKQANSGQLSALVDGVPPNDASQGYISWMQRGSSPAQERTPNRAVFNMGFSPQQLDVSLYGTPVANARANISQQSPIQVMHQDSVNLLPKTGGQTQNSVMQPSGFSNPFLKDQYNFSQNQRSMPQGGFMSNQGFQGKNVSGTGLVHGLNSGLASGNVPMANAQRINSSLKNFNSREEGVGWSEMQPRATQPSKGLVPLDPLEEKILFDMEDNNFADTGSGGFGNTFDSLDFSNACPSIQSGSWSALMQSAVAEASSSDTGIQEDWSGLTFQNTEPSADNNQLSNLIDGDKQQAGWVNKSLPSSTSFSSKPLTTINNSSINSGFPNFQQLENQLSDQPKEGIYQDGSTSESVRMSAKVTGHWVDCIPQQKPSMEGNRQLQSHLHSNDSCVGKTSVHAAGTVGYVQSHTVKSPSGRDDMHASNLAALSNPFQSVFSSHDLSQRAHWNNLSGTPGILYQDSMHHMQSMLNESMASQSGEAKPPDAASMQTSLNLATSLMSSQDNSMIPAQMYNVWADLQARKHPLELESLKIPLNSSPPVNLLGNSIIDLPKVPSPEVYNAPQIVGLPQNHEACAVHISDVSAPISDLLSHTHSPQSKMDGTRPVDNHRLGSFERNFAPASHSLKQTNNFPQNYSLIHQLQAANNTKADPSKRDLKIETVPGFQQVAAAMEQNSRFKMPEHSGINSTISRLSSFASDDTNLLSLMLEARKNQNVKASSQHMLSDAPSSGMVAVGQCHSQNQSNSSIVVSNHSEPGQVNLHATPTWHKQHETFKIGQMLSIYDARNIAGGHLSSGKSSQDADVRPNDVATLVESSEFKSPYVVPSGIMNQNKAIMRPKKRKLVQQAWHKDVTQGSESCQSMSMAEQDWAQATNRFFEKVEDKVEMIEWIRSVSQSKRRLIFTTQLIQQLIHPAPALSLSADASLAYDSISYFVARGTLGDACSLLCSERNALTSCLDEINIDSEKVKTSKRSGHQEYSVAIERFIGKAGKMENDFQRLEKAASFADIRVEIQDLERFAVINRFAKFHSRAQGDTSGRSLSFAMPRPVPQRYVTAVPLPRNLPAGALCLSL